MERKIYAVFVAGGSGTRMGSALPKQFLELGGIPILQRTIENIVDAVPGVRVVTVLPSAYIGDWKELCVRRSFLYPQILVEGGITRFHSVRNALARIPEGAVVMIHDGVRPFVGKALINRLLAAMETSRAAIPVMPVTDTLKSLRKDESGKLVPCGTAPDRSVIFGAQTPQVFRSEDIKAAYDQAYDTAFTDDASVAERLRIPVSYVSGDKFNLKITTPEDLEIGRFLTERSI